LKGRVPTEDRHAALMVEMRGDGIAPDGHDPEVIPRWGQAFTRYRGFPSAPPLANRFPSDDHHRHGLNLTLPHLSNLHTKPLTHQRCVEE
jgi:hypothetical protein